jgi:hypothetical protein
MKAKPLFSLAILGIFMGAAAGAEASNIPAAKTAYAEIVFVQGTDLLLLRSDGQPISGEPIGARLSAGDQIQTGRKTTVELVTMPRKSRLRLSENTVVTIGSLSDDGSTSLKLLYGRLRSKVEKLAGTPPPYNVVSRTFMAGVRGTDFGCDVLVARAGEQASAKVYCFEGSVEVAPPKQELAGQGEDTGKESLNKAPEETESFAPVLVSAGGMAVVEESAREKTIDIAERPIDITIKAFWHANEFTAAQPVATAEIADSQGLPPGAAIDLKPIREGIHMKNRLMGGSLLLFSCGVAFDIASAMLRNKDNTQANDLLIGGATIAAMGLPIMIYSISIDPLNGKGR